MNIFDTRLLNEDLTQSDNHFTKINGKLRNFAKKTNQRNSNSQIQYYEPKHKFMSIQRIKCLVILSFK